MSRARISKNEMTAHDRNQILRFELDKRLYRLKHQEQMAVIRFREQKQLEEDGIKPLQQHSGYFAELESSASWQALVHSSALLDLPSVMQQQDSDRQNRRLVLQNKKPKPPPPPQKGAFWRPPSAHHRHRDADDSSDGLDDVDEEPSEQVPSASSVDQHQPPAVSLLLHDSAKVDIAEMRAENTDTVRQKSAKPNLISKTQMLVTKTLLDSLHRGHVNTGARPLVIPRAHFSQKVVHNELKDLVSDNRQSLKEPFRRQLISYEHTIDRVPYFLADIENKIPPLKNEYLPDRVNNFVNLA